MVFVDDAQVIVYRNAGQNLIYIEHLVCLFGLLKKYTISKKTHSKWCSFGLVKSRIEGDDKKKVKTYAKKMRKTRDQKWSKVVKSDQK